MKKEKKMLLLVMWSVAVISVITANFICRQFAIYEAREIANNNSVAIVAFAIIAFAHQDNNIRLVCTRQS